MEKMLLRLRPYRLDEMEEDDFNYEGWTTDIRYGPDGEVFEAIDKNSHRKAQGWVRQKVWRLGTKNFLLSKEDGGLVVQEILAFTFGLEIGAGLSWV